jgi:addiction module RelE/StbE family toxin
LKIIWTPPFERDFRGLPQDVQARAERVFALLLDNPRHPSLQAKRMQGVKDLWEVRVSLSYRITYQLEGERVVLRRIGTHDILRKESK